MQASELRAETGELKQNLLVLSSFVLSRDYEAQPTGVGRLAHALLGGRPAKTSPSSHSNWRRPWLLWIGTVGGVEVDLGLLTGGWQLLSAVLYIVRPVAEFQVLIRSRSTDRLHGI